jgi:hypothetical protein
MRLIRGGPGAGKTAFVFREFKQALAEGVNARLIVPTATLVRHFQHELARDGAVFSPQAVVSLTRFAQQSAEPLKPVTPGLQRALVRDALRRDTSAEFAAVAGAEGMVSTILDTIGLFENAGATPEPVIALRKLKGHAKAFAALWLEVAGRTRNLGFATRPEIMRAASQSSGLSLWFDGFVSFSPIEAELLRALSRTCQVTVTLSDATAADEFRRLALQWGCEEKLLSTRARHPEISAVNAISMEREADEIARRILDLHGAGTPFQEIGIGLRDAAAYLPLLRGTFERFGIPARYFDTIRPHCSWAVSSRTSLKAGNSAPRSIRCDRTRNGARGRISTGSISKRAKPCRAAAPRRCWMCVKKIDCGRTSPNVSQWAIGQLKKPGQPHGPSAWAGLPQPSTGLAQSTRRVASPTWKLCAVRPPRCAPGQMPSPLLPYFGPRMPRLSLSTNSGAWPRNSSRLPACSRATTAAMWFTL